VRSSYTWAVSKRFSDQSKTLALSIPATSGTGTANYQLTVTKSLATQMVTVSGTLTVIGTGSFPTPTLTFAPAPAAVPTGSVSCIPANTAPATCTFAQTWSDNSIAAAAGGVLTVSIGSSTQTAPYNFAGVTGGTTGNCAVVSDNFAAGSLTGTNMQMTGNYPPSGLQICDIGDKLYEYAVVFSNMQAAWCAAPLTVRGAGAWGRAMLLVVWGPAKPCCTEQLACASSLYVLVFGSCVCACAGCTHISGTSVLKPCCAVLCCILPHTRPPIQPQLLPRMVVHL
jgi:hypothetical protein